MGTSFIHRETLSLPISRRTELTKLLYDTSTVFFSPIPALLQKLLTCKVCLVDALLLKCLDNLNLRCDGSMVGSRLPQCIIPLHSLVADQDILHGIIQCMSHVKLTGNIWRWHHNGKRFLAAVYFCMKIPIVLPLLIETILYIFRIVCFT